MDQQKTTDSRRHLYYLSPFLEFKMDQQKTTDSRRHLYYLSQFLEFKMDQQKTIDLGGIFITCHKLFQLPAAGQSTSHQTEDTRTKEEL